MAAYLTFSFWWHFGGTFVDAVRDMNRVAAIGRGRRNCDCKQGEPWYARTGHNALKGNEQLHRMVWVRALRVWDGGVSKA